MSSVGTGFPTTSSTARGSSAPKADAALTRAFDAVWLEHNTSHCSLRTAAYMIAIRRVKAATELAGMG